MQIFGLSPLSSIEVAEELGGNGFDRLDIRLGAHLPT
jgi:hypothetical protein